MPASHLTLVGRSFLDDQDDVALARALIREDARVTFVAWTRLRPLVDVTLRRLMGPGSEVEDLAQEVFLRFFRRVPKLRDPRALRSFLFGICLRTVRRELRNRWLRRFLRLTETGDPPDVAAAVDPADDGDAREVVRRYYRVLEKLGGTARSLYVARHIERLPLAEVAALHGLSVSTVQRKLGRITQRVAAMVGDDPLLSAFMASRLGERQGARTS
jgi:RNA polymerase sigma-70 factor (ECF subfamily)